MKTIRKTATAAILFCLLASTAVAGEYKKGKKAYEQGDFDTAVKMLVQQLREKPKHKDSAELLQTVLPIAYQRHQAFAADAESRLDWDVVVTEYRAISRISNDILTLPPIFPKKSKKPIEWQRVDVTAELKVAVENAAEAHYEKGLAILESGGGKGGADEFAAALKYIPNYKDAKNLAAESHYLKGTALRAANDHKGAAIEFRSAKEYVSDYKDASELYGQCRAAAIKRVAVMPFDNKSGKEHFGAIGELMSDQILSKALEVNPEFIEFVNRDQLSALLAEKGQQEFGIIDQGSATRAGKLANVHAFVFGKILMVNESFPPDNVSGPQNNSVEWKNYNTGQVEVLNARFFSHERKGSTEVTASLSIVDGQSGAVMQADQLRESIRDFARWITFTGDERAVPNWAKNYQTPGGERSLKPASTMLMEAVDNMSTQLAAKLVSTFE